MKKTIPLILVLAVAGFLAWRTFHRPNFMYAGTVEATEVDLSPQVSGVISAISVKEGEEVQKDRIVVTIAGEDYKLAAQLADRDFKRAQKLHGSGSLPEEAFEKARYRRDETELRVLWCTIRSPLNGTVLERYHEPGELVNPGMKILTLANLDEVWAYVYVPQTLLAKLSLNSTVPVILPELPAKKIEGRIDQIRDEAEFTPKNVQTREERTRLVYGVKISFENKDRVLKPGMTVEVNLPD